MPGTPITDRQVRRYMEQRRLGAAQVVAAAKAGFSERTARRLGADAVLPGQCAGCQQPIWRRLLLLPTLNLAELHHVQRPPSAGAMSISMNPSEYEGD